MRRMLLVLLFMLLIPMPALAQSGTSPRVIYNCTGTPCPWGEPQEYHLAWPGGLATNQRLGYTLTAEIYLPASLAVGTEIEITAGSASIYISLLDSQPEYLITTLGTGQSYTITSSDVVAPEHIQLHSFFPFSYIVTYPETQPVPVTFYPTPPPLTDGVVMDAMSLVADETIRISATSLGMYILAPVLLLGGMHLLWGFIVRRRS